MRISLFLTLGLAVAAASAHAQPQTGGLAPGRATYTGRIEYHGQSQDGGVRQITVSDTTIAGGHTWVVVSQLKVGDQTVLDSVLMRTGDLHPIARRAYIGPERLVLAVEDSMVTGMMKSQQGTQRFSIPLRERSFLNYYALRAALREWPIEAGWQTTAGMLELNGMSALVELTLAVEGEERVRTPVGEFDCWIVHVTAREGIDERWWVSKAGRHLVRTREPIGAPGAMLQLDLAALDPAP